MSGSKDERDALWENGRGDRSDVSEKEEQSVVGDGRAKQLRSQAGTGQLLMVDSDEKKTCVADNLFVDGILGRNSCSLEKSSDVLEQEIFKNSLNAKIDPTGNGEDGDKKLIAYNIRLNMLQRCVRHLNACASIL